MINPIVSLLDVELDTALELTNLLYERLVLFVMECTNVFKLLDTKVTKKDCYHHCQPVGTPPRELQA